MNTYKADYEYSTNKRTFTFSAKSFDEAVKTAKRLKKSRLTTYFDITAIVLTAKLDA